MNPRVNKKLSGKCRSLFQTVFCFDKYTGRTVLAFSEEAAYNRYTNTSSIQEAMNMPLIPSEALPYLENEIYLPMIMTILERDRRLIEQVPFKLKTPYLNLLDDTMNSVTADLRVTASYLRRRKMKVIRRSTDELFTEYVFLHGGYEDSRRYLNVRLRNRTEELLNQYLRKLENRSS